jgi:hypothetical protein
VNDEQVWIEGYVTLSPFLESIINLRNLVCLLSDHGRLLPLSWSASLSPQQGTAIVDMDAIRARTESIFDGHLDDTLGVVFRIPNRRSSTPSTPNAFQSFGKALGG